MLFCKKPNLNLIYAVKQCDNVGYSIQILCQQRTIVEVTVGGRIGEKRYRSALAFLSLWQFNIRLTFFSPAHTKKLQMCYSY